MKTQKMPHSQSTIGIEREIKPTSVHNAGTNTLGLRILITCLDRSYLTRSMEYHPNEQIKNIDRKRRKQNKTRKNTNNIEFKLFLDYSCGKKN